MNITQEIVKTVRNLPPENQRELLEVLQNEVSGTKDTPISEEEVQRILFERGVISTIPRFCDYEDADDDFEPVEIKGKPLSETVIEERR
jgi:hypothetical protein